jgi:hypothetical protein
MMPAASIIRPVLTSSSTRKIQQWSSKRARPLLGQWPILIVALVFQIIGLRISKFFKRSGLD